MEGALITMDKKIQIMIFGTGDGARKVLELIDLDKVNVIAYLDNDVSKQGELHNGVRVINPQKINTYKYDYIVIGSMYYEEIIEQLIKLKVDRNKIVKILNKRTKEKTFSKLVKEIYEDNMKYTSLIKDIYLPYYYKNYAICSMNVFDDERNKMLYNYPDAFIKGIDYVRISTLELISREIKERNVVGEVAELGVYKGDFSKLISELFPDRKLYLFDTFEGFVQEDVEVEKREGFSKVEVGGFENKNIDLVISKIRNKDNIIVKKGYFPESVTGMKDEVFSFVSIDVDLYKPTYEGLNFFYNRLSKGGYILIHDYNHPSYPGVKKAVIDFCTETGVSYVPLTDCFGSVIIVK